MTLCFGYKMPVLDFGIINGFLLTTEVQQSRIRDNIAQYPLFNLT